jgi:hypothetical protein
MPSHDIQVAFFKIYQDNETVYVDFVIEKDDLLETFKQNNKELSQQKLVAYLN